MVRIRILQQTVTSQLIKEFKHKILDGEWELGDQIPTETELSQQYAVGRSSIREALQHLIAVGLLERRKKQIFVSKDVSEIIAEPLSLLIGMEKIPPDELFETRLVLEIATAGLAALRRDQSNIEEIRQSIEEMENSRTIEVFMSGNIKFHKAVAKASKNQLLYRLFEGIQEPLNAQHQEVISRNIARAQAIDEHKEILHAIETGDNQLAEMKMSIHLKRGLRKFLKS